MAGDWLTYSRQPEKRFSKKLMRDWSEAPPELLSLILSNLFFKDRLNFKLVCRSWSSIVPNKPLLPPPTNSPYFHSPCLIFPQNTTNRWKTFHSVYNDFYYLDFPPELKNADIKCSKDGWLLMSLRLVQSPLFFFNPLTRETFELPPTSVHFFSVCFTSPPTSGDCFVFGVFRTLFTGEATEFGLIKFGDEEWELGPIVNHKPLQRFSHCPPLFANGVFYCVCFSPRGFRIFDPKKIGGDRWIPNDDVVCLPGDHEELEMEDMELGCECYIAEVDGEICCVFVTKDDGEVSVIKWDFGRSRWKKLESFGGKCLYVSRTGMFAETCINGMENKIFFNKSRGKSGVMYSLATKRYHSVEGDFASRYAYGLTHVEHGSWIKFTTSDKMLSTYARSDGACKRRI